jgi:hypothetical protein
MLDGHPSFWLASHSAVPQEAEPSSSDRRRLGVAIERIVLAEADLHLEIGHAHPSHDHEEGHRWTDGMAHLPEELLRPFADEVTVEVHLIDPGLRYPLAAPAPEPAPAQRRKSSSARR